MSQRSVELSSRYVAVAVGIPVVEEIDDPWHGLAQDPTQLSERAGLITWGAFGSMWEHVWEHEANFSALFFAREENRVLVSTRAAPRAALAPVGYQISTTDRTHGWYTAWTSGLRDSSGRAPSRSPSNRFRASAAGWSSSGSQSFHTDRSELSSRAVRGRTNIVSQNTHNRRCATVSCVQSPAPRSPSTFNTSYSVLNLSRGKALALCLERPCKYLNL